MTAVTEAREETAPYNQLGDINDSHENRQENEVNVKMEYVKDEDGRGRSRLVS